MQNNRKRAVLYCLLALFVMIFMISLARSELKGFGVYEFLAYLSGITTFFIVSNISFSEKTLSRIFSWLCAITTIISFAGLIFYMLLAVPRVFATFVGWDMIAVSFPNAFALFLLMVLPITIYKVITSDNDDLKLFFIAATIQLSAFVLTFSRESWLVLAVAVIVTGILFFKLKHLREVLKFSLKRIIPIVIIACLMAYCCSAIRGLKYETPSIYKKITFQADEGTKSYSDRMGYFSASLKMISAHPVLGEGPGVFQKTIDNHQHNLLLKIANDDGVLALIIFVLFFVAFGRAIKFNYKNLPENSKNIVIVLSVSIGLALAQNLVDYNLNFVSNAFLFWSFIGIIASIIFQKKFAFGRTVAGHKNIYIISAVLFSVLLLAVSVHEGFYKIDYVAGKTLYKEKSYTESLGKFTSAQNLFFKGDLNYLIGQTYYKLAETKGFELWGTKGMDFLAKLPDREKTIETYRLNSEFCLLSPGVECLTWSIKNIKNINDYIDKNLNPFEHLRDRYDIYKSLIKAKKDSDMKNILALAEKFLADYLDVVEQNEHLTITTENPSYAIKTYELLIDFEKQIKAPEQKINELTLSKARLTRTINREKKKYEALYNQPAYEE